MSGDLRLLNRQRVRPVDLRLLRRIGRHLLSERMGLKDFDLTIHLVNAAEMGRLNQTHLQHEGSTDVITLDYANAKNLGPLAGEIFVCLDDALLEAKRFRTTWQDEVVRYIIHGVLHLRGHDDTSAGPRKLMKREELRYLRQLNQDFHLSKLRRKTRVVA